MNKIIDFISGIEVQPTPEEIEATQPFSHRLVEDLGYPKEVITTRPQFRVKKSPSDKKGVPVDIAVFEDEQKSRLKIIVECKRKGEKLDDTRQLEAYMSCGCIELGVMYNGSQCVYLHRNPATGAFSEISALPRYKESLADIGRIHKSDLIAPHNLKEIFKEVRGWIVANGNVTRDEEIAEQMILLILCKIFDERFTESSRCCVFSAAEDEDEQKVNTRIQDLFSQTRNKYGDVVHLEDVITFDAKTIKGVVARLQRYSILQSDRDCIADAFEVFIGKSVKETEGQFFTPRNVVNVLLEAMDIKLDKSVIDPACGSGGFLVETLRRFERMIRQRGAACGWNEAAIQDEIKSAAIKDLRGIEKDPFLTKLTKSYMAILGDGKSGIFEEDSLNLPQFWKPRTQDHIRMGGFDYVVANPPFGKDIKVEGERKLAQYSLAYKENSRGIRKLETTGNVSTLFLERIMQLARPGGTIGVILPEPYFCLPKYGDAFNFMFKGNNVRWVIDLPHDTFRPHNNAKCCAIVIQKGVEQQQHINMAVMEAIGHNHQGKPKYKADGTTLDDDTAATIAEIADINVHGFRPDTPNLHVFSVPAQDIISRRILVPRFYWKNRDEEIIRDAKQKGISLLPLKKLVDEKILTVFSGHGSPTGALKGEGNIPYIRVKDIVNWQPYIDVTSLIPEEEYLRVYTSKKELRPKDILYVSRGSYRIGSVAMVSPYDGDMLLTREILVFRLAEGENKYGITPEYLLYALSHRYVWEQTKNKIFYEPCLPNISDRWENLSIPVYEDASEFAQMKERAKNVVDTQWEVRRQIAEMKSDADAYMI